MRKDFIALVDIEVATVECELAFAIEAQRIAIRKARDARKRLAELKVARRVFNENR